MTYSRTLSESKFIKEVRDGIKDFKNVKVEPNSNLTFLNLTGINLRGAEIFGVDMYKSVLRGAVLKGTSFHSSGIVEADLTKAKAEGIGLSHASASRSILTDADLTDARLCGTDIRGAVGLDSCNLNHALFCNTVVTEAQKRHILKNYIVVETHYKDVVKFPKAQHIRVFRKDEAFKVLKEGAKLFD